MTKIIKIILVLLTLIATGCNSGDTNVRKGTDAYLAGNYQEARTEYQKALTKRLVKYSEKQVYTMLGNTYNELEQYDSAVIYHKKSLKLDPNYVEALVNLGIVYRLTSKYDQAEICYKRAMEINPKDPELYASLGALYVFRDDPEKAIQYLERSIELDPELAIAHSNYSMALAMVGEYEKSETELLKAESLGYKNGAIIREKIKVLKEN